MWAFRIKTALIGAVSFVLVGCEVPEDRSSIAPPEQSYLEFHPIGVPGPIRYYGDRPLGKNDPVVDSYVQKTALRRHAGGIKILALSGGGADGAFGAGILTGWTQTGARPEFDVVTGISTGSLIAPFAFLGPKYDANLQRLFTGVTTKDIVKTHFLAGFLGRGFLGDTTPLRQRLDIELSDAMLHEIAREYHKGRQLLIGTTNIDAERPVVWNIGEIAAQGTPEAFELARDVLLASASIPILFEPVAIPVTDGTRTREELHVDGGLKREVFVYSEEVPMRDILRKLGLANKRNTIWVIHNKKLQADYSPQTVSLRQMAPRAFDVLIRSQSIGDIARIAALAERDGFHMQLQMVPQDFNAPQTELFDRTYMTMLFDRGVAMGKDPSSWFDDVQRLYQPG